MFVLSWFSLIGQSTAHAFMMVEMQKHQAMGHDMGSHCQPVLCESVISLDDQTGYGLDSVQLVDMTTLPATRLNTVKLYVPKLSQFTRQWSAEFDPPPIQLTGILRI